MAVIDPYRSDKAYHWDIRNAVEDDMPEVIECDVVISGTGAGGGICAEILSQAGLRVVLLEEGGLQTSTDFRMKEGEAYDNLYQQGAARATKDGAITILQGRTVGGSTTVNWTSSFRTPEQTLKHWQDVYGVKHSAESLDSSFSWVEQRLNITRWDVVPNRNNQLLADGCQNTGWSWKSIPRNVKGCWNLGYCGMGCPSNAKQSMLVTTIPASLEAGATLITRARAEKLIIKADQVDHLAVQPIGRHGKPLKQSFLIKARRYILAAGAIGSPAILLRSSAPDPYNRVGKRTFLHPVCMSVAVMPDKVEGYYGAPQSVYSDHFLWRDGVEGELGYKLESTPLHPVFTSLFALGHGDIFKARMQQLPHMQSTIALMRDGFHEQSRGGQVKLNSDSTPVLDYPVNDYLWKGVRDSLLTMAELQFSAGAASVRPVHQLAKGDFSWSEVREVISSLPMERFKMPLGSAHVMGGCAMGEDERLSVVNSEGQHHQLENLSVIDGSVFPTSIGANPQESVYGLAAAMAGSLSEVMKI